MRKYGALRAALPILMLLTVSGCVVAPGVCCLTPLDLFKQEYHPYIPVVRGPEPKPTYFKPLVQEYMIPHLVDPENAQYENWSVFPGARDGYVITVEINDKDASGNYSGPTFYHFILGDNDTKVLNYYKIWHRRPDGSVDLY